MGIRNRMTRDALRDLGDEEFGAFLDDVADSGLRVACESRQWTQSATLNWIAGSEKRAELYGRALKVRAELAIHEGREIVDGATPEDAGVAKLRSGWRQWEASKWNRERYGERVQVEKSVTLGVDAGLVGFAGELLAKMGGRVIESVQPVALGAAEAEAGETVGEPSPDGRVSTTGVLPPSGSPRQSVAEVDWI